MLGAVVACVLLVAQASDEHQVQTPCIHQLNFLHLALLDHWPHQEVIRPS